MKKKKLKKEIKELKEACKLFMRDYGKALEKERSRIDILVNEYPDLQRDFEHLRENLTSSIDTHRFEINDIYEKLKILKLRTETDYTQFKPIVDTSKGPDDAPPTCETCRWKGLGALGPDSPCYGCIKEDKKMYEPITYTEEPNGQ